MHISGWPGSSGVGVIVQVAPALEKPVICVACWSSGQRVVRSSPLTVPQRAMDSGVAVGGIDVPERAERRRKRPREGLAGQHGGLDAGARVTQAGDDLHGGRHVGLRLADLVLAEHARVAGEMGDEVGGLGARGSLGRVGRGSTRGAERGEPADDGLAVHDHRDDVSGMSAPMGVR